MLEEMGVKVWWPQSEPAAAEMRVEPAPAEHEAAAARAAAGPAPALAMTPPARAAEVPSRSAAPPQAPGPAPAPARTSAASAPGAAALCISPPQRLYAIEGQPDSGGWLVVVDMPPSAEGLQDGVLDGEAGRLLDQMLRALRLHAGPVPVHAVRLWRAAPGQPSVAGSADFDTDFESAVAPLAPRVVLALGPLAAQRLLGQQAPLGRLRGSVHRQAVAGAACAVVASYPPAYLLRNGADKARAWADLCLAAEHADGAAGPTGADRRDGTDRAA
ncbi:MAG: uracil-DNA glycosylase [Comamonadaceae bacterium]|nr:MAG: uracil-DNA glycosylase [Comamonadaceae bacterium]